MNPGNNEWYTMECKDPGNEGCVFKSITVTDSEDFGFNNASLHFDQMFTEIEAVHSSRNSGEWSKNLVSEFEGRQILTTINTSWSYDINGTLTARTRVNTVYI